MLCSYPANKTNLQCLCLIQNIKFLNFSSEHKFGSHLCMFSLETREWEPMLDEQMDEGGVSLHKCLFHNV